MTGNDATPVQCAALITGGSVSVSDDGNTLTVSEMGKDPPSASRSQTFGATCTRLAASDVRCGSDGGLIQEMKGGSGEGGTAPPPPACTGDSDCPGNCSRCDLPQGVCRSCPIGTLGVCTC